MSRTVTIEFPDDATDAEIGAALDAAEALAREYAQNCRLRAQEPKTRRYAWFKIANTLADSGSRLTEPGSINSEKRPESGCASSSTK